MSTKKPNTTGDMQSRQQKEEAEAEAEAKRRAYEAEAAKAEERHTSCDFVLHLDNPACTPANDPWAHRSEGMRCKTCMWFAVKAVPLVVTHVNGKPTKGQLGRCRRHAPTMNGYPAVFETDWCGDHKLDEGKI